MQLYNVNMDCFYYCHNILCDTISIIVILIHYTNDSVVSFVKGFLTVRE